MRGKGSDMGASYQTRVILDPGSNRSFCTERLVKKLGIIGRTVRLMIDTVDHESDRQTIEVDLEIVGVGRRKGRKLILHKVLVISRFPRSLTESAATEQEAVAWKHLQGIKVAGDHRREVELLLAKMFLKH